MASHYLRQAKDSDKAKEEERASAQSRSEATNHNRGQGLDFSKLFAGGLHLSDKPLFTNDHVPGMRILPWTALDAVARVEYCAACATSKPDITGRHMPVKPHPWIDAAKSLTISQSDLKGSSLAAAIVAAQSLCPGVALEGHRVLISAPAPRALYSEVVFNVHSKCGAALTLKDPDPATNTPISSVVGGCIYVPSRPDAAPRAMPTSDDRLKAQISLVLGQLASGIVADQVNAENWQALTPYFSERRCTVVFIDIVSNQPIGVAVTPQDVKEAVIVPTTDAGRALLEVLGSDGGGATMVEAATLAGTANNVRVGAAYVPTDNSVTDAARLEELYIGSWDLPDGNG